MPNISRRYTWVNGKLLYDMDKEELFDVLDLLLESIGNYQRRLRVNGLSDEFSAEGIEEDRVVDRELAIKEGRVNVRQ